MAWVEKTWTEEINEVSTGSDVMNAVVNIIDPSLVTTTWNIETNTPVSIGNGVIAAAIPARINWPLRAINDPGTATGDPSVVRAGRISIPLSAYSGPLRTGLVVVVLSAVSNPDLVRYVYRIDEAINGSNMANRVAKITVDGESSSGGSTPLPSGYGMPGYGDPTHG